MPWIGLSPGPCFACARAHLGRMKTRRVLFILVLPLFLALSFVGLPPPIAFWNDLRQPVQTQTQLLKQKT